MELNFFIISFTREHSGLTTDVVVASRRRGEPSGQVTASAGLRYELPTTASSPEPVAPLRTFDGLGLHFDPLFTEKRTRRPSSRCHRPAIDSTWIVQAFQCGEGPPILRSS